MKLRAGQSRDGRTHNWHRMVPSFLLTSGPRWRGRTPPTSSRDPRWQEFCARRDAFRAELLAKLAAHFKLTRDYNSEKFYADLSIALLGLFPAWMTTWETRGRNDSRRQQMARLGPLMDARKRLEGASLTQQYKEVHQIYAESGAIGRAHRRSRHEK